MNYKIFGNTGLRVSELALGTMTFGNDWGWGASKETCKELLSLFLDAGGNFIDTADYYTNGSSEKILGDLLEGIRNKIVLATKYTLMTDRNDINSGGNHRKNMVQSLEQSLKRLKTDYLDVYWVHIQDEYTPIQEVMRGLEDLTKSGKILYIGISDTPAWKVAKGNTLAKERNWNDFNAIQVEYSLIERSSERELIPMAQSEGMSVLAWSPLAGGLLSGKYSTKSRKDIKGSRLENSTRVNPQNLAIADAVIDTAQELNVSPANVALAWLRRNPSIIPLVGSRKVGQLKDNLECVNVKLENHHIDKLNACSKIQLGFPHDFIASDSVKDIVYGNFKINH